MLCLRFPIWKPLPAFLEILWSYRLNWCFCQMRPATLRKKWPKRFISSAMTGTHIVTLTPWSVSNFCTFATMLIASLQLDLSIVYSRAITALLSDLTSLVAKRTTLGATISPAGTNSRSAIRNAQLGSLIKFLKFSLPVPCLRKRNLRAKYRYLRHDPNLLKICGHYWRHFIQ